MSKRPPDYARRILNQVTRPLNAMLRKLERFGAGDSPGAQRLRAKIKAVKDRTKGNGNGET